MNEWLLIVILLLVLTLILVTVLLWRLTKQSQVSNKQSVDASIQRLEGIEQRLNQSVYQNTQSTHLAFNQVIEHITKLETQQGHMKEASESILKLQSLLYDKKARGVFGEVELYHLLSTIFGDHKQLYQKQYMLSNGSIVDCAIFSSSQKTILPIDAKFPLENFNRCQNIELTKEERNQYLNEFKKDVVRHINAIATKYIIDFETTPIAFMFVPSESIVGFLYDEAEDIIQYGYKKKVFIVSFSSLVAYLTTLKSMLMDYNRSLKTIEIQKEYQKLSIEMNRFIERYYIILKDFDRISQDIKNTDVTISKIVQKFNRIQEVDLDD